MSSIDPFGIIGWIFARIVGAVVLFTFVDVVGVLTGPYSGVLKLLVIIGVPGSLEIAAVGLWAINQIE